MLKAIILFSTGVDRILFLLDISMLMVYHLKALFKTFCYKKILN